MTCRYEKTTKINYNQSFSTHYTSTLSQPKPSQKSNHYHSSAKCENISGTFLLQSILILALSAVTLGLDLKRGFLKGLMFQDAPLEAQPKCDDHSVLQRVSLLVNEKEFLCDFAIITNETLQKVGDKIH